MRLYVCVVCIYQNEMRILSSIDEKKRKQSLTNGEQNRERMDKYQ